MPTTTKPFHTETWPLFAPVRDHAFEPLAAPCGDDFGLLDVNAEGGTPVGRNRAEWEAWFRGLFAQLDQKQAQTWSQITDYEAIQTAEMDHPVVDFDQRLVLPTG